MFSDYTDLFRLTWEGTLGAGPDETFSYSRWVVGHETDTAESIGETYSTAVTDMLAESSTAGPFTTIGQTFHTSVVWTFLHVWAYFEGTGVWNPEVPRVDIPLTDHGTGSGLPGMPYQCSMAVTLRTSGRGRRERNRFYLPPMLVAATDGQSRWLPQLIDDIQTQQHLYNLARQTDTPSTSFAIYSPADHLAKEIANYYTGDVVDTIRRRRRQLTEVRHVLVGP